jgi:hypothetical protein
MPAEIWSESMEKSRYCKRTETDRRWYLQRTERWRDAE